MALFDVFRRGKSGNAPELKSAWTTDGVVVRFSTPLADSSPDALLDAVHKSGAEDSVLGAYLAQLAMEGCCEVHSSHVLIPWHNVYELLESEGHQGVITLLGLPPVGKLFPILSNSGSIAEPQFELEIVGWSDGIQQVRGVSLTGAVAEIGLQTQLLSSASWLVSEEISQFRARSDAARSQHENELAWGRIRQLADRAGVLYSSPYLETTIVLTPQTLRLPISKAETPFGRVLTVAPTFDNAPDGWITAFDGFNSVQEHYNLTKGTGRVRVIISEPVRKVLEVIKREMPNRRVAGKRAEKFLHNPWAFLGDTASEVISEEEFAQDRGEAGAVAAVFSVIPRIKNGHLNTVDLSVSEHFSDGSLMSGISAFRDTTHLAEFVDLLEAALSDDCERFPWNEYDLTVDAEATVQLEQAKQVLHIWRTQPAERISYEDIYLLDGYSGRIEGIGIAKPIYVPAFQKPTSDDGDAGWLPSELIPMVRVSLQGQQDPVLIPLDKKWVDEFEKQVLEAEKSAAVEVTNTSLPTPLATPQARTLLDSFQSMIGAQERVRGDGVTKPKEKKAPKQTLLIKTNFQTSDYVEERKASLSLPSEARPELPKCLNPSLELKAHQLHGIAWFQHLVSKAPSECRGALLADDMGLGKTIQLLVVLAWYYERNPNASPSVVFAPKSLLQNWANEAEKFFTPSFPEVSIFYGAKLQESKQPLDLIDEQLRTNGITDLLKPNWVGTAKIIVTTYEVLTSYEFSFARQPFAFVICDEAQRIKTPGTFVTLAVKKLKADFRVACTGTPVENNLSDLWCLFDFVQPFLLGTLDDFGKTYRKPIECQTEELKTALAHLQELISPQTLRRTKADIAGELKKKYFGYKAASESRLSFKELLEQTDRLDIAITEHQRILYKGGLKKLQDASKEVDGRKRARLSFGALHLMKAVCSEPYCLPGTKFLPEKQGREVHLNNSPKLKWILNQLEQVRSSGEKAIIFTELREAQAALYYFLRETFGIKPFTINGDSENRQSYIDKFSANDGFDVIILSTLAAGAGLNVTAANHVFHFTRAWNPAKENQATDRAYRIGQTRDVHVYCPTVIADDFHTFDVRLDELLKKKAGLANTTLDSDGMTSMLNGTGGDASFSELVGQGGEGADIPRRILTMDDVDRLDGFGFEVFCSLLWSKQGYQARVTEKAGGDGGIDVVAIKGREGELLQCKSSINTQVGWDAIKEVTAGASLYQARYSGTRFKRVAVTNQFFNTGAVARAETMQVQLITRTLLEELLAAHPVTNHEIEQELISCTF